LRILEPLSTKTRTFLFGKFRKKEREEKKNNFCKKGNDQKKFVSIADFFD